jgi:hypothetical protein
MQERKMYTTSELAFAAYLKMKGVKMLSAARVQGGRFEFVFDDPTGSCDSHLVDFLNSDFGIFDAQMKSLKKIIYSKK